jgi:small GTP-binding protein
MPPIKLALFGLDNAGKTAISMTLKNEKVVSILATKSFEITRWFIKSLEIAAWDAPGQIKYREGWKRGYEDAQVLMYVLDTTDAARFDESKREFDKIVNANETAGMPLLFCFNKMDLPEARANHDAAMKVFNLRQIRNRKVYIFDTSITDPESFNPLKDALVKIIQKVR